jgi:replicative superfamily II helicase
MSLLINKILLSLLSILIFCIIAGLVFYIFFYRPMYQSVTSTINCNNQTFIQISENNNGTFLYPGDIDIKLLSFQNQYFPYLINQNSLLFSKDGLELEKIDQKDYLDIIAMFRPLYRQITESDKTNLKFCFPQARFL